MENIKLIDIGSGFGPRRQIRVTDGVTTQTVIARLTHDSDFLRTWDFYAYGKTWEMRAEMPTGYLLEFSVRRKTDHNRIWDRETQRYFTMSEMEQEYILQRQMRQTEVATFDDYLENITGPNGTCEWEYARGND